MRDLCVKCGYQDDEYQVQNIVKIVGSCAVYLNNTFLQTYIELTHEAFIIAATIDDPIINIPAPNDMAVSLNADPPCQYQNIEIDYQSTTQYPVSYNTSTVSFQSTFDRTLGKGLFTISYIYHTLHTGLGLSQTISSGNQQVRIYEPSTTLTRNNFFATTQLKAVTRTVGALPSSKYQGFLMSYYNESLTMCNSLSNYLISSSPSYIEPPSVTLTIDAEHATKPTIFASDTPESQLNITFYVFVKSCVNSNEYLRVGPLEIQSVPCNPSFATITASSFSQTQSVLSGNATAFFKFPAFTTDKPSCPIEYTITQLVGASTVASNLTVTESNGTVYLKPLNQTIGQIFENITIKAASGGATKKVEYSSLTITQRVCSIYDEFLNSGGNCEKCPGGTLPDGTLYGCASPQTQATNTSENATAGAAQEEQPQAFNLAPFFESDIEPHDTYFLDLLFLGDATDEIEITITLPQIIDADSNFQSIEVTQEVFGSVKARNLSGEFEIENEGDEFKLSFADDRAELKIKVFKAITQSYIGEQKFEIILRDDLGEQAEYDFALNFQIAQETNLCIRDRRDQIEPYHIQTQYNFIEGAKYEEVTICCEDGQSMTNFEALDQTVKIAKERNAYGFFLRVIEEDNFQAGFYSSKQDMEGDWVSHDDCVGTVGFKNDFDITKESQNDNNSNLQQKDSERDAISIKSQGFQQNGVMSLRFSEELTLIESLMPMTNISGLNSTSIESLKDINTHITELVDIKYFTNIEVEEGFEPESLKVPELESYSIESFNPWQVNFKLKFANPLHVSSLPEQDHVQVVVKEPRLFKAASDGHLIEKRFKINKIMVPPQTPSEEAYQAIQRIGSSIKGSLIVTLILPICFMLFMKVSMNRIWALFYMLQLIANLRNIKNQLTPANAQVVLDMTDNIVNFKLFQNDFVQNFLNEKVMTEKTQWIKSVMIDQGIDTTNTILFVAGLGLIFAGAQVKIFKEFFEKQKKQWMWGGILRSKLTCYLPNCIIVFTQVKQLYKEASAQPYQEEQDNDSLNRLLQESQNDHDEQSASPFDFAKNYWRMLVIFLLPVLFYFFLKRNKDQLQSKKFNQKFGILYVNLKLDKRITLTFMSIFCLRRISLALFAVFLSDTLILNIYVNIFSSLAFIKLLFDTKPMEVSSLNTLEIVNEMNMLYFNYSLFLYTQLVPDVETRYAVGYVFVFLASTILIFNFSVISWSIFQEALFNHRKKKAEKAWEEFDLLKDKMARFLAVKTYQKIKKSFGEQTIDIEEQQRKIKEEMSYSQMQDKILSIFEGEKSPNEPQTSQMNVFKLALKQMVMKNTTGTDNTPRFRNDESNSKLNEPSSSSEDSLPSQFSVDEDKLLDEIVNLEVAKFSKRSKIERKSLYQDDDFQKYHQHYQEITTEYDQKIKDLQSKARMIREYKGQKEQISQEINLVSILQKDDKDALIKKSQLDKRFIKTSLSIKKASIVAQTTPKFSSVLSPKKTMLKQIKEQNSSSLRIKSRSESYTERLEAESAESKVVQEILSQGTDNTKQIILDFIPSVHPWMSTNQMNSFAYKILIAKPEVEKLTDAAKQKVFHHFNAKMKLSDEDAQKVQFEIWGQSSQQKPLTFKSQQKRFV